MGLLTCGAHSDKIPIYIMQKLETRPALPVGDGDKLERRTVRNKGERTLLFAPVRNRVLMVNPQIHAPLRLIEGEPSPLGLFAVRENSRPSEGEVALEIMNHHQRSALLTRALFSDSEGRIYRDIDLKGTGVVFTDEDIQARVGAPGGRYKGLESMAGLLERDFALHDYKLSEEFLRIGIRTHRVIGIIRLLEVLSDGERISLYGNSKFRVLSRGIIGSGHFRSVIQVRAFGTKARVEDISDDLLYEDAKKMVSRELGYKRTMIDSAYLYWFAKTLGTNIGIMHRNGWTHRYLTKHNVTLDCRIVDLDSVGYESSGRRRDLMQARNTISILAHYRKRSNTEGLLTHIFSNSYQAAFSH